MAQRRILVLGGYGLIGLPIVRRLIDDGNDVFGLGRDPNLGKSLEPRATWIAADIARLLTPQSWKPLVGGLDIVINASGALQSGRRDDLPKLQQQAIIALIEACEDHGPQRFIQISAPGASPEASTEFLRTKGAADERLRKSSLDWQILKPALVISPNAYGGTALLRMLASLPWILPIVHGSAPVSTVDIDDVVEVVARAIDFPVSVRTETEIAEENPRSLEETILAFRQWLGLPPPIAIVRLPRWAGGMVGRVADALGHLGWRSPLRTTALEVMAEGVTANPGASSRILGRSPRSLPETLRRMPSTVQERWFAKLYLAMPLMIGALSLFWIASGLIGLLSLDQATPHLTQRGIPHDLASVAVVLASIVDVLIGTLVLFQSRAKAACIGMIAVTAAYLGMGSLGAPELWADPLGPYVKTIPAAMLALVCAMLVKTR